MQRVVLVGLVKILAPSDSTFCCVVSYFSCFSIIADSLTVQSLLELVDEESLRKDTALPSPEWSSDHIALLAEFRCKPKLKH